MIEELEQSKILPITKWQINRFIGLCSKLSGKCVKVMIDGVETTFTSNECKNEKFIHVESTKQNITWIYDGVMGIKKLYGETSLGTLTKGNSGPLDRGSLGKDLNFFSNSLNPNSTRSRLLQMGGRLKNVLKK